MLNIRSPGSHADVLSVVGKNESLVELQFSRDLTQVWRSSENVWSISNVKVFVETMQSLQAHPTLQKLRLSCSLSQISVEAEKAVCLRAVVELVKKNKILNDVSIRGVVDDAIHKKEIQ